MSLESSYYCEFGLQAKFQLARLCRSWILNKGTLSLLHKWHTDDTLHLKEIVALAPAGNEIKFNWTSLYLLKKISNCILLTKVWLKDKVYKQGKIWILPSMILWTKKGFIFSRAFHHYIFSTNFIGTSFFCAFLFI